MLVTIMVGIHGTLLIAFTMYSKTLTIAVKMYSWTLSIADTMFLLTDLDDIYHIAIMDLGD